MASIWLYRRDWEDGLPDVCMKCGKPARGRVLKTFHWMPGWVYVTHVAGVLVFVIAHNPMRLPPACLDPLTKYSRPPAPVK